MEFAGAEVGGLSANHGCFGANQGAFGALASGDGSGDRFVLDDACISQFWLFVKW